MIPVMLMSLPLSLNFEDSWSAALSVPEYSWMTRQVLTQMTLQTTARPYLSVPADCHR
jgi:hypothetical protein